MRKCKVDEDNAIGGNTDNVENYFADMSENLYLYTSLGDKAEVLPADSTTLGVLHTQMNNRFAQSGKNFSDFFF